MFCTEIAKSVVGCRVSELRLVVPPSTIRLVSVASIVMFAPVMFELTAFIPVGAVPLMC